jgi:F-type H+-transporting ATPase subunit b
VLNFSVTFFFTIVNIAFLYLVLKKILFKPVTKFMEDRSNSIEHDLETAKRTTARAEALLAEYEAKMKNAQEEGRSLIQAAREKAELEYSAIIQQAKTDAEKIMRASKHNLEEERLHAALVLQKDTADISILAASRILGENIDTEKNRSLVSKFLESVGVA